MTKRTAIILLAAAAVAGTLRASSAPATTVPGVIYPLKVTITNTSIVIQRDKFSLHTKYPRYPRGALIRYVITNKGTRPFRLKMWGTISNVMKPKGGKDSMLINWNYRGKYLYETLYKGKPAGPKGYITIF